MSNAIKVENLSKAYQLGEIGTGTMSRDLERWFAKVRGMEDPFLKIGESNDRAVKGTNNVVWSLKGINFEIEEGNAVGIIGRNGAGKSTLLKILSRVTSPTTGKITGKGRIASLLEVGTGFHPELTGRENIYLNGAILGMRKKEITRKFEEIVDFAGVERYIDTPVKRYSSGMYVRLAFAVAAHLESEILIVDEVLAVGDAEFQKKCLGKMNDVSKGEGRTVLFVSHNMGSIKQLCKKLFLLKNGEVSFEGEVNAGASIYLEEMNINQKSEVFFDEIKPIEAVLRSIKVTDKNGNIAGFINYNENFYVEIEFLINEDIKEAEISVCFKNSSSVNIFISSLSDEFKKGLLSFKKGLYRTNVEIEPNFLIPDNYYISVYIHFRNNRNIDFYENILKVTIIETGSVLAPYGSASNFFACVFAKTKWQLKEVDTFL